MKLSRLRIEQLRRFRAAYEIADIQPGLNIFTGPNGAGKSTIVRAIRAAFLERYRSSAVDDLRPEGDSAATPSVELAFELNGIPCLLQKSFLGRKRCELQLGGERFDGEAAEQRLAEIVGFQFSGRGASKQEHWGIPGLLWIEQGAGHEIDASVAAAADHLRGALGESLGAVTSSDGDELVQQVLKLRGELLTAGGKPRGPYSDALAEHLRLTEALAALDRQIAGYRQQVDTLAQLQAEQQRDTDQSPWEALQLQEREAAQKLQAIHQRSQQLDAERQRRDQCIGQLELIGQQLAEFTDQRQLLVEREHALDSAAQQLERARAELAAVEPRRRAAQAAYDAARQALPIARNAERRQRLQAQLTGARQEWARIGQAFSQASRAQGRIAELQRQLRHQPIATEMLDTLRRQAREQRELAIRAEAVATRLRYTLVDGSQVQLNGETLSGGQGEAMLLDPATLSIPGTGSLEIIPGGAGVGDLGRRQDEAREAHRSLLDQLGFSSLEAAEARHADLERIRMALREAEQSLALHAPQGLEALAAQRDTLQADIDQYERELAGLASSSLMDPPPLALAEQAVDEARAALDECAGQASALQEALGRHRVGWENAQREHGRLLAQLQAPERQQRERALQDQLVEQRATVDALERRIEEHQQAISAARPAQLEQDVRRFRSSADNLRQAFDQRKTEIARLLGQLEQTGSLGLEEQRAELAGQVERAEQRSVELARRARALDLLVTLLQDKRRELTRRLQAPLQRHLNHYLQLLFPGAAAEINEDLTLGRISRPVGGTLENAALAQQSFGTREQLALIGRLAYADLLREAGRPTHIILDDCLVHSDRQRLEEMKRILFDAAERHQILLFTCHPDVWRDMGVAQRPIGVDGAARKG